MKRSYAVIGTGAVGGLYGARLQQAGHEVHFLCRSDYEHVCASGLEVKSVDGDIRLPSVQAYRQVQNMPKCDVVLVALKATGNNVLKDILPRVMKVGGTLLLLQNGLRAEDELSKYCPEGSTIIGGLCFLCCNKIGPGLIHHLDYGKIELGQWDREDNPAGLTDELLAVQSELLFSGTDASASEDLLLCRWRKLVWNMPFNGMTVLFNTTTADLMRHEPSVEMGVAIMREVVRAAAGFGRLIEEAFVDRMLDNTRKMVPYKPSMLLDYEAGKPMELEAIYGNPIRAARSKGVEMPATWTLYNFLKFLEVKVTGINALIPDR